MAMPWSITAQTGKVFIISIPASPYTWPKRYQALYFGKPFEYLLASILVGRGKRRWLSEDSAIGLR